MLRTQISLTESERALLDAEAARTGRSIAALIRDAVQAAYGERDTTAGDLGAMRRAYGSWAGREIDGETWVEEIRSGRRLADAP